MTNTVHSVGTLSIATAERALPCPLLFEQPSRHPSLLLTWKMRPRRLTDSQPRLHSGQCGFELMKIACATRKWMRRLAQHDALRGIFVAANRGEVAISGHLMEKHPEIDNNCG